MKTYISTKTTKNQPTTGKVKRNFKRITLVLTLLLLLVGKSWGQTNSYLGLDGGFEGAATIVNASTNPSPVVTNWTKSTATATIASETTTVRSGNNSMKISSSSATLCRVFSPSVTVPSSTTKWQVQYYRRAASITNTIQNQTGNYRGGTEQSNGTYNTVTSANTWQLVTYSPTTTTAATTAAADVIVKMYGTGTDMYYDDFCIYESAVIDVTAASAPTSFVETPGATSIAVSWIAASGGVDGGGYIVVRGISDPTTAPNVNGIYAVNNTIAAGMTVVYQGTGTSFTDNGLASGTQYFYRIYTYDKAYNYSSALTGNGTTTGGSSPSLTITGTPTNHGSNCVSTAGSSIQYTITNSGGAQADGVSVVSNDAQFVVSGLSSTSIAASGGTATYNVTFTPSSAGSKNATITVSSSTSGSNSPTSSLTGTGISSVTQAVTSSAATSVVNTTATLNGNVTTLGVCPASTEKGFVYSLTATNANPLVSGSGVTKTSVAGVATGAYTLGLTGLTPNSGYTFKAYVYDGTTYTYGATTTFTTLAVASKLAFSVSPPATGNVGANLTSFTVQAQRPDGTVDAEYTGNIVISKASGSGAISGTLTVAAVAGVASFSTVQFDAADTYTVTASSGALTTVTSGNIVVSVGPCGSETFTNSNATSSYANNSYTGDNGVTWTYVASRDENGDANSSGITGKALMLQKSANGSKVTSSSVAGGIGDFTITLYKGFTGAGNRQVELFVNGVSKGTSTIFDDLVAHTFTVTGINISGNVIVEIRNTTANQVIVDDISWTCYAASPTLTTTALTDFGSQCPGSTYGPNSFTINGTNLTTADVTVGALAGYTYSTTSGGTYTSSLTLPQAGGTYTQDIFVKFAPIAIQSYNGNIAIGGGGATSVNRAVTGAGANTAPTVTTTTPATAIGTTTGTCSGNVTAAGCQTITARGICYGTSTNPDIAGTKTTETGTTGTFSSNLTSLTSNTLYYFRAYATSSAGTSYGANQTFTTLNTAPTTQASLITFSSIGSVDMTASWTNGNGSKRVVIMNTSNSFTDPTDGTDPMANTVYGGTGEQVVYNNSSNTVTVTGLSPTTTYWFRVYEYNNTSTNTLYNITTATDNPKSATTILGLCLDEGFNSGTTAPTDWAFTTIGGTYSTSGNYGASSPSLQLDATNDQIVTKTVTNASELKFWIKGQGATGSYLLVEGYNGSTWSTVDNILLTSITTGTTMTYNSSSSPALASGFFQFRFTYTRAAGNLAFDDVEVTCASAVTLPEPTNHATSFSCGSTSSYNIPLSWVDATGSTVPTGYLIKWSSVSYASITAPLDGTAEANGTWAKNVVSGIQFANISGLNPITTYYFKIFPYTNSGINIDYKTDGTVPTTSCATLESPCMTESFENTTFPPTDWTDNSTIRTTNGTPCSDAYQLGFNGTGDYIITKAIDNPKTLIFYYKRSSSTDAWSLKVQKSNNVAGPWTDVQTISDATESCQTANIDLTAYTSESSVYFKFLDTRSSGTVERYIDNINIICNACSAPATPTSNLSFSSIVGTGMTLNWTSGNGTSRMIIARAADPVTFSPVDLTTYTANSTFGAGTDLGSGQYCVYNGTGSSVSLLGLSANTLYHFAIYEYNCEIGNEMYISTPLTGSQGTTDYISAGAISGSPFCVSNSASTNLNVPFTYMNSASFTSGTASFTAELSDKNGNFNNPVEIGTILSNASGSQTINATIPAGTESGTNYKIRVNITTPDIMGAAILVPIIINNSPINVVLNAPMEDNAQATISWNAPLGCFDGYMVVVSTATIAATPTGNGSGYTANTVFGSGTAFGGGNVVQNGTTTSVAITGLTNGTTYYVRTYTRWGTEWSTGSEIIINPNTGTVLNYGDLAILSVNTDQTGGDEISFVAFKTIISSTTIDFTDNGYERASAGKWGNTEGTLRLTRTGASVPAGTVITFVGISNNATPVLGTDFNVYVGGAIDNLNWTIASINGTGPFDLNENDQIWILQHGTWTIGGSQAATYDGSALYGWTATGWKTAPAYLSTQGSTIPASAVCAVTNVAGKANQAKVKYTGPSTPASKIEWIGRINEATNWSDYADNTLFDNGFPKYKTVGSTLNVLSGNLDVPGKWAGYSSTSWCDCANWKSLTVPTATDNVEIPVNYTRNVELSDHADSLAVCKNLIIHGGTIFGKDSRGKKLTVNGDLIINGGTLDFGGTSNADGQIIVYGNFIDSTGGTGFIPGKSLIKFSGGNNQSLKMLNGIGQSFYHLQIDKSGGAVNLFNDIQATDSLTFTNGKVNASTYTVTLGQSIANKGILMYNSGYVNGKLRRWLDGTNSGTQTGLFPVGTASYYRPIKIEYTSAPATGGYLTTNFVASPMGVAGLTILAANSGGFGMDIEQSSNDGYWKVDNQAGALTDGLYTFTATLNGANGITNVAKLTLIKRVGAGNWLAPGTHVTASGTNTSPTVSRTGLTGYSNFGLGSGSGNSLPIELTAFTANCNNNTAEIHWSTASETNNSHFILERSNDSKSWQQISQITGAGNSSTIINYAYTDKTALDQGMYRLIQVDFDGKSTTFDPIAVNCKNGTETNIEVYPNPFNDQLTIKISNSDEVYDITLLDINGKVILENKNITTGIYDLNTSSLAPGVYALKVKSNSGVEVIKVVRK